MSLQSLQLVCVAIHVSVSPGTLDFCQLLTNVFALLHLGHGPGRYACRWAQFMWSIRSLLQSCACGMPAQRFGVASRTAPSTSSRQPA